MNIMYISSGDMYRDDYIGVRKKILGQVKGMKYNGHIVHCVFCEKDNLVYYNNENEKYSLDKFENLIDKKKKIYSSKVIDLIKKKKIDTVYIRYTISDYFFIRFIKELASINIDIYLDIPTFPYDKELSRVKLTIDKIYRLNLKKYIKKVIVSSNKYKEVFGVECIYIDNGVDTETIPFSRKKWNPKERELRLVGVSLMRNCVGYDRVISGISKYYEKDRNIKVKLTLVGDGEELENLKNMTFNYKLEKYINFIGTKNGHELNEVFENTDIAIGSLGDHRLGVIYKSPLKSREYCARGIPFISSIKDTGFKENNEFILNIEANDEPVDIEKVIEFYNKILHKDKISEEMRTYSVENFDWKVKYKDIF